MGGGLGDPSPPVPRPHPRLLQPRRPRACRESKESRQAGRASHSKRKPCGGSAGGSAGAGRGASGAGRPIERGARSRSPPAGWPLSNPSILRRLSIRVTNSRGFSVASSLGSDSTITLRSRSAADARVAGVSAGWRSPDASGGFAAWPFSERAAESSFLFERSIFSELSPFERRRPGVNHFPRMLRDRIADSLTP
jgi:hypothetical protein